jgi:hypothetical protein
MKWVPLYVLTALVNRTAQLLWAHEHRQRRSHKPVELSIPVGFSNVAGSRSSSAVSAKRCREGWVRRFNFVVGILRTVGGCRPSCALFDVARNQDIYHFPRLCSAYGHAPRACSLDCMHNPLDILVQAQ